jgi:hypothetical protein
MTSIFATGPPTEDVLIGDMRFKVEKLTAWRNLSMTGRTTGPFCKALDFPAQPVSAGVVPTS